MRKEKTKENKHYEADVVTEKEERFAKNSNKKVIAIITRTLLGLFGVDKFIMGCNKRGVQELVFTAVLIGIQVVTLPLVIIPLVGAGLHSIFVFFTNIVLIIRFILSFVLGLKMILLTPREIAEKYEKMM